MRRLRTALATTAVACLLTACGGGGNPEPAPLPRTSSPSPTASPSATPPVMPAAARGNSRHSAQAFVRHYVDVLNYATFTGDTAAARTLDDASCKSCQRMLGAIDSIYRGQGAVVGGAWAPTPIGDARFPDRQGWTIDARIRYGPQTVTERSGAAPKRYTGGSRIVSFILRATTNGGWSVSEWTRSG